MVFILGWIFGVKDSYFKRSIWRIYSLDT